MMMAKHDSFTYKRRIKWHTIMEGKVSLYFLVNTLVSFSDLIQYLLDWLNFISFFNWINGYEMEKCEIKDIKPNNYLKIWKFALVILVPQPYPNCMCGLIQL